MAGEHLGLRGGNGTNRGSIWIGSDGGSFAVTIPFGGDPGRTEASKIVYKQTNEELRMKVCRLTTGTPVLTVDASST